MKNIFSGIALASLALGISNAHAQYASVVISGEVKPGVYGRVEFGNAPPPPLLYAEPVIIVRERRPVPYGPVYLHVPPGHAMNWDKHCQKYNACNRPVYFVKSAEHQPGYGKGKSAGKGKGKGWN